MLDNCRLSCLHYPFRQGTTRWLHLTIALVLLTLKRVPLSYLLHTYLWNCVHMNAYLMYFAWRSMRDEIIHIPYNMIFYYSKASIRCSHQKLTGRLMIDGWNYVLFYSIKLKVAYLHTSVSRTCACVCVCMVTCLHFMWSCALRICVCVCVCVRARARLYVSVSAYACICINGSHVCRQQRFAAIYQPNPFQLFRTIPSQHCIRCTYYLNKHYFQNVRYLDVWPSM